MSALPWAIYESALDTGATLTARHADGATELLAVSRWLADADPVDERLIARAEGPVLDVGCGPGRHVSALLRRGTAAVGLDASPIAVRIASERGAETILGDVFTHGLELGAWQTVLLLDGNLGIGGDPQALLARVRELLAPGGRVLVEAHAPGGGVRAVPVRLEHGESVSTWFPWARVSIDAIDEIAVGAGLTSTEHWSDDGRWFAELRCR